jgi:hypothetical protein
MPTTSHHHLMTTNIAIHNTSATHMITSAFKKIS